MPNGQLIADRSPSITGTPPKPFYRLNVIDNGDGTCNVYVEDRANSDGVSTPGAVTAAGLQIVAAGTGTITGGGTINTVAKFTAPTAIGDSHITDDGSLVTVTGNALITGIVNAGPGNNFSVGKTSVGSKFEVFNNAAQTAAFSFRTNDFVLASAGSSLDMAFTGASGNVSPSIQVYNAGATGFGNLIINSQGGTTLIGTTTTTTGRAMSIGGAVAIGTGDGTATPGASGVIGASATGADHGGAALIIAGGQGTGTGVGGNVNIQVANKAGTGSSLNGLVTVFTIAPPNTGTTVPANGFTLTSAIAGGTPSLTATGSDTDIGFSIGSKGAGTIRLNATAGVISTGRFTAPDGAVNAVGFGFTTDLGATGFWLNGSTNLVISSGNSAQVQLNGAAMRLRNSLIVNWSSGDPTAVGADVGLARKAIGLIEVNDGSAGTFRDITVRQYFADQTITAGGTTGDQTINKSAGTVNIAAGGTTVTVTCSLCTVSSTVFAVIRTADATARIANVVPGAGSFVINIVACTAEVSIGFLVINQ